MAAFPTTAPAARPFSVVRTAERIAILGIAIAFVLTAYSRMGGQAESTVAQASLAAITPLVHAYVVENGDYAGMTIGTLRQRYDPSLDTRAYTLVDRGSDGYCIETTYSGHTWHVSDAQDAPVAGAC